MDNIKIHRKIAREKAVIGIYQYLLTESSIEDIDLYLKDQHELSEEKDYLFAKQLIINVLDNTNQYINLINKYLKNDWKFDRLPKMEQSILLVATCEILETDLAKEIIVNEAVVLAKKYCDETSYKYINGVLGKIN